MADVFISYSQQDRPAVEPIVREFERFGWTVFWDQRVRTGAPFDSVIESELNHASAVLVVWSRASVESEWVRAEATAARNQSKAVPVRSTTELNVPVLYQAAALPVFTAADIKAQSLDAKQVLRDLARLVGKPAGGVDISGQSSVGRFDRTVGPGRWRVHYRVLRVGPRYGLALQLNADGTCWGKAKFLVFGTKVSGRWKYDVASQVLQLDVGGQVQGHTGMESHRIAIRDWIAPTMARCRWGSRHATLIRAS